MKNNDRAQRHRFERVTLVGNGVIGAQNGRSAHNVDEPSARAVDRNSGRAAQGPDRENMTERGTKTNSVRACARDSGIANCAGSMHERDVRVVVEKRPEGRG